MTPTASDYAEEKNELRLVLNSGIFHRAPNLANLLTYVCTKYFEGAAEQIKEYNIAVEALGRLAGFDPKRDSIVRVEAHRLRKRLREYYEAEGAGHSLRIEITSGQYVPQFLRQVPPQPSLSEEAVVAPEFLAVASQLPAPPASAPDQSGLQEVGPLLRPAVFVSPAPLTLPPAQPNRGNLWLGISLVTLVLTGGVVWRAALVRPTKAAVAPVLSIAPMPEREVRVLAGLESGTYTDRFGRTWESDRYYEGGAAFDSGDHPIAAARDTRLFRSRREGAFSYDIPLPPGDYEMRLYFVETLYGENNMAGGGESSRIFTVSANGAPLLTGFDVIADAGASTSDIRAFKDISPAADGKLHLRFVPETGLAMVSAIEITPGTRGKLLPIRMVSRDHPYTDKQGRVWDADSYARGGQLVMRPQPVANLDDRDLLHGERYGNLNYVIPVPPGRYGVTFYFAETWFGPRHFAGGGAGNRLFDILCNGIALRRGFDIYKEAGGSDRALTLPIHGIEPNPQGKIDINLMPVRNYAELNAIEVVDESR
jgi:Malectin domain